MSVEVNVEKRVQGGANETIGELSLPNVPREEEFVQLDSEQYRVQNIVYTENSVNLIVS